MKPVPTIFDPSNPNLRNSFSQFFSLFGNFTCFYFKKITKRTKVPRRSVPMLFSQRCHKKLKWHQLKSLSIRILISTVNDQVVFLKLTNSRMLISEVTGCIQVDSELHVKLFYIKCSIPLPQWFRQGQNCRLSKKSMFGNFLVYLESYIETISLIFDEL